ncbi:hypothetical protein OPT61_g6715 [Boeremia exigua]|uniref:Uncharacterized protein n=1 Tax=Boeremia exigua TaxID=749465 RepID=A0ACC2I597_9PLEO|nr:hypothetical protein OPT61_g6715 [Boeremia exigua]
MQVLRRQATPPPWWKAQRLLLSRNRQAALRLEMRPSQQLARRLNPYPVILLVILATRLVQKSSHYIDSSRATQGNTEKKTECTLARNALPRIATPRTSATTRNQSTREYDSSVTSTGAER